VRGRLFSLRPARKPMECGRLFRSAEHVRKFAGISAFQPRILFGETYQVQLVFLSLAKTSRRIGVRPQLVFRHVFEAGDHNVYAQDRTSFRPRREVLVAGIRGELNAQIAAGHVSTECSKVCRTNPFSARRSDTRGM
jgi:hypothetical protein